MSAPIPVVSGWLNLSATVSDAGEALSIREMKAGAVPVPSVLANLIMARGLDALGAPPDILTGVQLTPESARLDPSSRLAATHSGAGSQDLEAIRTQVAAAQRQLQRIVAARAGQAPVDAAEVLSDLLNSAPDAADAVAENRAAIIAMAAYVNKSREASRAGSAQTAPVPLQLHGRVDLAEHFFTSAALQSQGGSTLTNLVGDARELNDAGTGSGFSFRDMAANRAGIRFSELATGNAGEAREIRRLARSGLTASDIIPPVDWLPENMDRATFERDFGGSDSRAYQIVVEEIDRRIENAPVVQTVTGT
jgi:hypothetical protein